MKKIMFCTYVDLFETMSSLFETTYCLHVVITRDAIRRKSQ